MTFRRIAIAGASGFLGRKIIEQLSLVVDITRLTILTRSKQPVKTSNNSILSFVSIVSYEDTEALANVLQGHDLLISTIAGAAAGMIDAILAEAAVMAGVRRFMPSEYTVDVLHPHSIAFAGSTILATKLANARKLQTLASEGKIEYTTLVTGAFLDFWLSKAVKGIVDLDSHTVMLYDGGEHQVTGCTTDFIAQCVRAVVTMPEDATRNSRIRIAEVQFSGKQLLGILEEVTGEQWTGVHKDTDALVTESLIALKGGDTRSFYVGQILKLGFDGEGSCYFEEGLTHGEDEVQRLSLNDIVRHSLATR
ncbi:NAD(P)-binding protein [Mollisia scopiformis]|uniref:NAD(P)-binding protein n=1 Tax=Mollisia scopiformis TaxID=149040 RepID=A0A132B9X9_MOLSC|nr:NAD(P)-binding protein [Mollisia scopiformis]KUJ08477.1 NAD(P)-binding protein [Mollisia scopiformis]